MIYADLSAGKAVHDDTKDKILGIHKLQRFSWKDCLNCKVLFKICLKKCQRDAKSDIGVVVLNILL